MPTVAATWLLVDDGDNRPLDVRSITAAFAGLPWIYFEAEGAPIVAGKPFARLAGDIHFVNLKSFHLRGKIHFYFLCSAR